MTFNSLTYLVFLLLFVPIYWALPRTPRLWATFGASLIFYSFWRVDFVWIMLLSMTIDYLVALRIEVAATIKAKRAWLILSICANLGMLGYFKYFYFLSSNTNSLLKLLGLSVEIPYLDIVLPLGISFYTFQTISYIVDVYRGFIPAVRSYVLYGCFVTFFPQLVAGPILRAVELVGELSTRPGWDWGRFTLGIRRIIYGLFLKVVLGDNIAPLVDAGFATPISALSAVDIWTLAFLFGFQIYFDFAGYSHIALGSAALLGFRFPENFNYPYLATSLKEFWRRWHISLSSWIRDYLYLPLMGAKVHAKLEDRSSGGLGRAAADHGANKRTWALFLTWAIMGLWHGANWTFVLWGIYHACGVFLYRVSQALREKLGQSVRKYGGWIFTLAFVMLGWIPFRATSIENALAMYKKLLDPMGYLQMGFRENTYLIAALLLTGVVATNWVARKKSVIFKRDSVLVLALETVMFCGMFATIMMFLQQKVQFIYFQF